MFKIGFEFKMFNKCWFWLKLCFIKEYIVWFMIKLMNVYELKINLYEYLIVVKYYDRNLNKW